MGKENIKFNHSDTSEFEQPTFDVSFYGKVLLPKKTIVFDAGDRLNLQLHTDWDTAKRKACAQDAANIQGLNPTTDELDLSKRNSLEYALSDLNKALENYDFGENYLDPSDAELSNYVEEVNRLVLGRINNAREYLELKIQQLPPLDEDNYLVGIDTTDTDTNIDTSQGRQTKRRPWGRVASAAASVLSIFSIGNLLVNVEQAQAQEVEDSSTEQGISVVYNIENTESEINFDPEGPRMYGPLSNGERQLVPYGYSNDLFYPSQENGVIENHLISGQLVGEAKLNESGLVEFTIAVPINSDTINEYTIGYLPLINIDNGDEFIGLKPLNNSPRYENGLVHSGTGISVPIEDGISTLNAAIGTQIAIEMRTHQAGDEATLEWIRTGSRQSAGCAASNYCLDRADRAIELMESSFDVFSNLRDGLPSDGDLLTTYMFDIYVIKTDNFVEATR